MLTNDQRARYFTLAQAAYRNVGPDVSFDEWRRQQQTQLGLPASTKQMDHVWDYEAIMLHYAVLADDAGAMTYFGGCARRRMEWVMGGFLKDLSALERYEVREGYVEGLIQQSKIDAKNAPTAEAMRQLCGIIDTRIRELARAANVPLSSLPTAGRPYCFRGVKAAGLARLLAADRAGGDE